MKHTLALLAILLLAPLAVLNAGEGEAATSRGYLDAGVGSVDITPSEPVVLAGSPTPQKSSSVSTPISPHGPARLLRENRWTSCIA